MSQATSPKGSPRPLTRVRLRLPRLGARFLNKLSIGWKLNLGFGLLIGLSLAVALFNIVGGYQVTQNINRTSNWRVPAALAASQAQTNLLKMVTDVHSYLTLNSLWHIADYYAAQLAFESNLAELERLMPAPADPEQTRQLAEFKSAFTAWSALSEKMFALHNNPRLNQPGLYLYRTKVEPLSAIIRENTDDLIRFQEQREPSRANTDLLADMLDFQTSFDAMLTNLRGYTFVSDLSFRTDYMARLLLNTAAWANLQTKQSALTSAQQMRLNAIAEARASLIGLPLQIFDIVQSEHAYEELYLFQTQSSPQAENMLRDLEQMTASQQAWLQADLSRSRTSLVNALLQSFGGGLLGLVLGVGMAVTFRNNIVGPVRRLTAAAERIGGGDLDTHAAVEASDEIGQLADTFNLMTDRLRQTITSLEKQTQQLETMKTAAEAASVAKSEFLANMSHELRTPLNGILGYAQILGRDDQLDLAQAHAVSIIRASGEHLLTLINDILDLSKIEARKMELQPAEFRLPYFLEAIVGMFQIRALQKKDLNFIYELVTPLPAVIAADEKRLRQILINLVGNAIKFTDQGEVRLRVGLIEPETGSYRTVPPLAPEGSTVEHFRFEVIDTGIGIPVDKLEAIFLPFEQASDPRHRSEGAGLGLTITKNLVEAMSGRLRVESEIDRGSLFRLDLAFPALWLGTAAHSPARECTVVSYVGPKRTLLVVDDEPHNRSVLVHLLKPLGFEMVEAENGQQALERAEAITPDAIFMDLLMPGMDGLTTVSHLRQRLPPHQQVVVIATSARAFEQDIERSLAAGCDAFLAKPVDAGELLDLLALHLKLTWIYRGASPLTHERAEPTDAQLIPPPPEEMTVLLDLALKGELPRLQQRALQLEQLGPQYGPFTARLCQLAEAFDEDRVLALIERYMRTPAGVG
jgi:signal transduction histidine kinase/DNA-binding NarL/FixJ family response regulator